MPGPPFELTTSLVRAGAGAGKTTGLVNQVREVYSSWTAAEKRAPRIVVTTFTRKATQELKERLIRKACADEDSAFLRFVSDPSKLHISTIHGLMSVFLKQVGHLAELDSGFRLLSEGEGRELARKALREVLVGHSNGLDWLSRYEFARVLKMCRAFNESHQQVVSLRPAAVADIESHARPLIDEWRGRLTELSASILEEVDEEKWVEFGRALAAFAEAWPQSSAGQCPGKPAKRGKVQTALAHWHDPVAAVLNEFKELFDKPGWEARLWPQMAKEWADFHSLGVDFSRELNRLKRLTGSYEMADLELLTASILEEKPFLGSMFADNWDYWMIDEYQDTSPLQALCLKRLIGDRPRYLVGDPQQSIYLFRGAEVQVFLDAERQIAEQGGDTRELMTNYRSAPELLALINEFMTSVDPAFKVMSPAPGKSAEPGRPAGFWLRAADAEGEFEALAARVSELVTGGAPLQSICVLGRTHDHLHDAAVALRKYGFPTHMHATSGFGDRREVMDAQALWAFLLNPHDNHNLIALLRSPWFYVADARISAWMAARPDSLWRHLLVPGTGALQEPSVQNLREALLSVQSIGVVKTFETFLKRAGYLDLALHNDPAGRKESNLWKLIAKARDLESEGTRTLLDLCAQDLILDPLEVSEGDATSAQEPNCINLMTVHGAKGLEFDHVLIPRVGRALRPKKVSEFSAMGGCFFFPLRDGEQGEPLPSPLDLAVQVEERSKESAEFNRALYVAATRAKSTLTMIWSTPERGSWADRSPWFQWAPGRHERGGFTLEVREQWEPARVYRSSREGQPAVRPRWRENFTAEPVAQQSVTGLIGRDVATPLGVDETLTRFQARSNGQRIHRRLEALKYGGTVSGADDPIIQFVLGLEVPPIKELVADGFTEWGFQVQTPRGVIEGQIDLWGRVGGRIYVVDYKSGKPARSAQAFEQLSLYAWALRRFGHAEPVTMAVVFPLAQKVELREFTGELLLRWEREFGLA